MAASFPAQVVAVVFRRAAVFQRQPGELATFPSRIFLREAKRRHVGLADALPGIPVAVPEPITPPGLVTPSDRRLAGDRVLAAIEARALAIDVDSVFIRASDRGVVRSGALASQLFFALTYDPPREANVDRIRALVSQLAVALAEDLDLARTLAFDLGRARDRAEALARALARPRDLADYLGRARALASQLAVALAEDLDLARTLALDLGRARDRTRAVGLAHGLANILGVPRDRELELASQLDLARTLALDLAPRAIEASGADLARGHFSDLSLLEGVIWTRETIWPPGVYEQVEPLSEEIAPGVYRVRGGTERDRSSLVTN